MSNETSHTAGQPTVTAAVVGSFSLALALVLEMLGVYGGANEGLWHAYEMKGFALPEFVPSEIQGLLVVAVLVYLVAWLICEIPGVHRRVLVLLSSAVLIALASPVLALWGVFWSPLATLVAMIWAGFCATLWASQHPMPCERDKVGEVEDGTVISMAERQKEPKRKRS